MVSDVPGMIIEAPQTGVPSTKCRFAAAGVDLLARTRRHFAGCEWGGPGVAAFNPFPTTAGNPPGTVADGPNGSTRPDRGQGADRPKPVHLHVRRASRGHDVATDRGRSGEEEKAFINDQSMMPTVVSMASAGLRKFQSLPNGDFAAYYPDYFGLDGKKAVLKLEDIEMKNVQIDLNDDALCTHAYVAGSPSPQADNNQFVRLDAEPGLRHRGERVAVPVDDPGRAVGQGSEADQRQGHHAALRRAPVIK